ncbi:50S ribosomal protein L5 [Patescibacteria group bacterium]|nr:50S ribosomal protein L5 [Patescibacteria group bacterium]
MTRLEERFKKEILKSLKEKLKVKNEMAIPRLSKIVVNMGVKDVIVDKKNAEKASVLLVQITGQKPKTSKAKKSISTFKLREGDPVGLTVTIRGKRMYDFFEKIVNVVLPRLRGFNGVKRGSFDGQGNYTLGFSESIVFPEIDPSKIEKQQGMEVSIVTTAKNNEDAFVLLEALGMPFSKIEN